MLAAMTGVPLPICNGVWAEKVDPDEVLVAALLSQVAEAGLPYCLQLRPWGRARPDKPPSRQTDDARSRTVPLMVLEHLKCARGGSASRTGSISDELAPEAAQAHVAIAATRVRSTRGA